MEELVQILPGRPVSIKHDGWVEFISIHDQHYLREKKSLMRRLIAFHPDKGKCKTAYFFRQYRASYNEWLIRERHWYWERKLMPPDWKGAPVPPPPMDRQTRSLPGDSNEQIPQVIQIDTRSQAPNHQEETQIKHKRSRLLGSERRREENWIES